jgi:murein DD-endopeptidase MepM/ murein hydrolase activator NlpD
MSPKNIMIRQFLILLAAFIFAPNIILADSADELRAKIGERNRAIAELEKEIAVYQEQINRVSEESKTLQGRIKELTLSIDKLNKNIAVTENKIGVTNYQISELSIEIGRTEEDIDSNTEAVSKLFRNMNQNEQQSLIELVLNYNRLSDIWNSIESIDQVNRKVSDRIAVLFQTKNDFEVKKDAQEKHRANLSKLKRELAGERIVASESRREKDSLLKLNKNTEANYRKALEEKATKKEEFERELSEFESQLNIAVDPSRLPSVGSGILKWPLDAFKITQYFGNTPFATRNPQIYKGKGHPGIDFRASVGTRVKAAASGVVDGVGDTDLVRGCYSYGKWILIRHDNGLSTLYAHLSLVSVSPGERLNTGDAIGYSGSTGYSTGPHLHFGVYATQGIKIIRYEHSTNCRNAIIPVADPKAYLNPLSYL